MTTALRPVHALTLLVPLTLWLERAAVGPVPLFITSCLAILPLAGLMGEATEHLARRAGPTLGGLLNATFGNAAELIIGFIALREGDNEIVKASLTGSILGNLLMVLGLAMLVGGWRRRADVQPPAAEIGERDDAAGGGGAGPAGDLRQVTDRRSPEHIESLSLDISYVLIATYVASLIFQFRTHRRLLTPSRRRRGRACTGRGRAVEPRPGASVTCWRRRRRSALVSEVLVGAVDEAGTSPRAGQGLHGRDRDRRWSATPPSTRPRSWWRARARWTWRSASRWARRCRSRCSSRRCWSSPAISSASPMGLEFTLLEVSAVMLSVMAVSYLVLDGRTNWFEGVQLLAIYAILGMTFFFVGRLLPERSRLSRPTPSCSRARRPGTSPPG